MHFSASIYLAPYLHQFSAGLQIIHYFGFVWFKFALNFGLILTSELKKNMMQKQHLLMVLLGTDLVSNISTKA